MAGLFGGSRQPGIGWGDRFAAFAAGMNQMGGAQQYMSGRHQQIEQQRAAEAERQRQEVLMDRLRGQLSPADTTAGSGTGAMPSRDQALQAMFEAQMMGVDVSGLQKSYETVNPAPRDPIIQNTRAGIIQVNPNDGSHKFLWEAPPEAPDAPSGYRWNADQAELEFIPGGPADPRFVGNLAGARRAPPRSAGSGGSSRGGGSRSSRPASPSRKPWERNW